MANEPITGVGGKATINVAGSGVTAVLHVKRWSMSHGSKNQKYTSSDTSGHERTAVGALTKSCTLECYMDGSVFPETGQLFTAGAVITQIVLYLDATINKAYQGMIDSVDNIEVDVEGSGMLSFTLNCTLWPE